MAENAQKVNPSAGCRFRSCFTFCDTGELVKRSDLSRIEYSIYQWDTWSGKRIPVEGHQNINVELSNFLEDGTLTDRETGEEFNLSFQISAKYALPFPKAGMEYELEVVVYDANGEPSAHSTRCYSTPYAN